jgi:hypothetical protein
MLRPDPEFPRIPEFMETAFPWRRCCALPGINDGPVRLKPSPMMVLQELIIQTVGAGPRACPQQPGQPRGVAPTISPRTMAH